MSTLTSRPFAGVNVDVERDVWCASGAPGRRLVAARAAIRKTELSHQIFEAAQKLMPGGVNSPVRAFKSVGGHPLVFKRVKGSKCWDVDGNKYIDYVGSWGPAILGASDPEVIKALQAQLQLGTSFGAPCELENALAEEVIARVPSVEMVRFVNSGTEACLSAARLMRAFTSRELILKFSGCYHGHGDQFLVHAGSGVATLGLADSPGVLASTAAATLTATYNDLSSVYQMFEAFPGQIAGVFVEPIVGNAGFIPPQSGFLEGLREITAKDGALLCLDEVMTGFRVARGGAQELFGIQPDLTTMGKIIGGGLPVGAYGGRADIMSSVAPAGPVYQAGTLSGNPLAMAAGLKTLQQLTPAVYVHLDMITRRLVDGLAKAAESTGHDLCTSSVPGMFGFFFCRGPIHNFEEAKKADAVKFAKFFNGMLDQGIYLAPSQFEAGFTSFSHSIEDIDRTVDAAEIVMRAL